MLDHKGIQQFILHPEKCVWSNTMEYFCESNLGSVEITSILLDAYNHLNLRQEEKWSILRNIMLLPQNTDTLQRLSRIEATDTNTQWYKDSAIANAGIDSLKQLPDIRPTDQKCQALLEKRMCLATMDTADLWDMLWSYNEQGYDKSDFDFNYGECIISELAKRNDFPYEMFLPLLERDYADHQGWDDCYLSVLAGELRCEAAIPFLIRSVMVDGDFICEQASKALWKIGTDNVVSAIKEAYVSSDPFFRLYILDSLSHIKTAASEEALLALFPGEKDITYKTKIGSALCQLFSVKGIPKVLSLIHYGYDKMLIDLEEQIYVNHVVNRLSHMDMDKWMSKIEANELRRASVEKSMVEGTLGLTHVSEGFNKLIQSMEENKKMTEEYARGLKVGRNDPCPCGSGKKYKKCCIV